MTSTCGVRFRSVLVLAALLAVGLGTATSVVRADDGATTSESDDSSGDETPERRTYLQTILDGGFVGLLLILLSFTSVGLIVYHVVQIRKSRLVPEVDGLEDAIRGQQYKKALRICDSQPPSLLTNIVSAGLQRYLGSQLGDIEYRAAVEEAGEEETARLYRMTDYLSLIGSIAPMLGLAGTVLGMINAFNTIASKGGMATPDELAGGISQALVTTLLGLVVAIPSMTAFGIFRGRIDSLVSEAGSRVERLLTPLGQGRRAPVKAKGATPQEVAT